MDRKKIADEVNKFTLGSTEFAEKKIGWKVKTTVEEGIAQTIEAAKVYLRL